MVVIGGGYTGINAARELARRGVGGHAPRGRTRSGWGASTRNGGIVHAGYKWSPRELIERYGEATGAALYRETLDGYETVKRLVAEESIDCDFREVGHVELAYAASHVAGLEHEQAALASVGVEASMLPRERLREEIGTDAYHGALVVPGSALLHPGRYFAGLAAAADRAGADLHERVRARTIRRQADGRFVVETDRGAILARDVVVATNGYTDGVAPTLRRRIIPIGSYIIASEPLPDDLVRDISPRGRAFFDTKNFLYYWHISADRRMVFGGRASMLPTSIDRTAAILHRGLLEVHPQLAGRRIDYAWGGNVGFTFDRMPHVGRTSDGVAYAMGCCGTGVALMTHLGTEVGAWLAGGEAPALARLKFPLVPAPYEGRPWFLPVVGEWYRLKDRLALRSRCAMRIGFRTSPQNTDWASLDAAWAEAGQHDVFDSGWLNDHLTDPNRDRGGPSFETMTTLAALAHHVPGKSVGQTVLAATFRHPAMLAKEAVTLDHVTGGRYILGAGGRLARRRARVVRHRPAAVARAVRPLRGDDPGASRAVQRRGTGRARGHPGRAAVPARWRRDGARAGRGRRPGRSGSAGRVRAGCAWPPATRTAGTTHRTWPGPSKGSSSVATGCVPSARRSVATPRRSTLSVQIIIPPAGDERRAALERAIAYGRAGASEILLTTPARDGAAGIRRLGDRGRDAAQREPSASVSAAEAPQASRAGGRCRPRSRGS